MKPPRFEPFRGWRFGRGLTPHLCPPYDIIGSEQARRLRRGPASAIHVELPPTYASAARTWKAWLRDGTVRRDPEPSFYLVEQVYRWGGRSRRRVGVLGALLADPTGRDVLPHERTFPKHRKDRRLLLEALRVNTSPVFGAFRDPGARIAALVRRLGRPDAAGRDPGGVRYRLWRVAAPADVRLVRGVVDRSRVLIADGHHRYRVASEFHRDRRLPGSGRLLAYLVPDDDPGLLVLPTHRLLPADAFPAERLERLCVSRPARGMRELEAVRGLAFGVAGPGRSYRVCRPKAGEARVGGGRPVIDVEWVQRRLLKDVPPEAYRFLHEGRELDRRVRSGAGVGVVLGALDVPSIRRAVERNGLMPQKSTYFYPKIATGLVFRTLDE